MDEAEFRRIKDVESLKEQFKNTKQLVEETLKNIESLKNELKEGKLQFTKTLNNLQKVQSTQSLKIKKLTADNKNFESMCINHKTEKNNLIEIINNLTNEVEKLKTESEKKLEENKDLCIEMDKEVKCSFVRLQCDQEMVSLWELSQNLGFEEDKSFKRAFFKTKAESDRRYDYFVKELTDLDDAFMKLREEIRIKKEQLNSAEGKYAILRNLYKSKVQKHAEIDGS